MTMYRTVMGVTLGIALLAGLASLASAAPRHPHYSVTTRKANAIVLKRFPHGKIVGKTKLEDEEGTWQYGVMVRDGATLREVMVNAKTGHIDNVEVTNAAKERVEAKADAAAVKHNGKATVEKGEKGERAEKGEKPEHGESR